LRVTNSGITAYITPEGEVKDATQDFQTAIRVWRIGRNENGSTFYSRRGDLLVAFNTIMSLLVFAATFRRRKLRSRG
jgi:apolipoprotein N-acyltransferase